MKKITRKQTKIYARGVVATIGVVTTLGLGTTVYSFASQLDQANQELALLTEEVADLKQDTESLLSEVEILEVENEEREVLIESLETDIAEYKDNINELSQENKELESEVDQLGKKLAALIKEEEVKAAREAEEARKAEEAAIKAAEKHQGVTQKERELLAQVLYHEGRGEVERGQIAVINVLLNRLDHEAYPDTITEVVYQPNQIAHVHEVAEHPVLPDLLDVVDKALEVPDNTNGSLFFVNTDIATCSWVANNASVTMRIGGHTFFK